jgi:hypothetical protein
VLVHIFWNPLFLTLVDIIFTAIKDTVP